MGTRFQAVILAAGRGERLRPWTDHLPKPLLSVAGRPVIVHHLDALARAGCERVFINISYLGDLLPRFLGRQWTGMTLEYSDERSERLETGGALVALAEQLGTGFFLLLNGDVLCDYPLIGLWQQAEPGLVLVDNPHWHPQGDFSICQDRVHNPQNGNQTFTYGGMAMLSGTWLLERAPGVAPLTPWLREWAQREWLRAYPHQGAWFDMGTPERLAWARQSWRSADAI